MFIMTEVLKKPGPDQRNWGSINKRVLKQKTELDGFYFLGRAMRRNGLHDHKLSSSCCIWMRVMPVDGLLSVVTLVCLDVPIDSIIVAIISQTSQMLGRCVVQRLNTLMGSLYNGKSNILEKVLYNFWAEVPMNVWLLKDILLCPLKNTFFVWY